MQEDEFEVFHGRSAPGEDKALLTIQRKGAFTLNRQAYVLMGEPKAVELLYNRAKQIIGMRPVNAELKHSYPVNKQPNSGTYWVSAKAFLNSYKIDKSITRRYIAQVSSDRTLTVDLVNGPQVAPRNVREPNHDQPSS